MKRRDALCLATEQLCKILLVETCLDKEELSPEAYRALRESQGKLAIILARYETGDAAA